MEIDITDDKSIQQAVEKVEQRLNGKDLNCLINNAGMTTKLRFVNVNEKDMLETYRQNVLGPWKVTKVSIEIQNRIPNRLFSFVSSGIFTTSRKICIAINST